MSHNPNTTNRYAEVKLSNGDFCVSCDDSVYTISWDKTLNSHTARDNDGYLICASKLGKGEIVKKLKDLHKIPVIAIRVQGRTNWYTKII